MNISAVKRSNISTVSSGKTSIDRQIDNLNKRKAEIVEKIMDVINGDDEQKVKDKKIEALRMEITLIDLQIQQLLQKKIEQERQQNQSAVEWVAPLPPSPSDLIQPDRQEKQSKLSIDIKI